MFTAYRSSNGSQLSSDALCKRLPLAVHAASKVSIDWEPMYPLLSECKPALPKSLFTVSTASPTWCA
jgi:hypothetical protein